MENEDLDIREKIEEGISKWVKFLRERGMLHGELGFAGELIDFIIEEFKYTKEENNMSEVIDRKFTFKATSVKSGKHYTEENAVLFLAKDEILPELLEEYYKICVRRRVDPRQIQGVGLLKMRVIHYQDKNKEIVHLPDVEEGKEEKRICKPNIV